MSTLEKCYSSNNEEFNFNEFDDLIADGAEVGQTYWEADCKTCEPTDGINSHTVSSLLECMDERLYDDIGEVYNSEFSNVSDEAKAELNGLIRSWAIKHIDLSRYWKIVGKTRECTFTAEDF